MDIINGYNFNHIMKCKVQKKLQTINGDGWMENF